MQNQSKYEQIKREHHRHIVLIMFKLFIFFINTLHGYCSFQK